VKIRFSFLLILLVFCFPYPIPAAETYQGPDDERAIDAAQNAVERLGPERGGIFFSGKIIEIIGVSPISILGKSVKISKVLKDLGAKQVGTEIQVSLSGDILFDFDKWTIKKEAESTLLKLAEGIEELNKKKVIIEGHTDSKGSEDYNRKLSQKRAEAVKRWFISKGVLKETEFETKGFGESKPVAPNTKTDGLDDPEGRAKNRRVEIRIPY